jgi:hypothetical protein
MNTLHLSKQLLNRITVATVIVDDHQEEEEVPCTGGYRPEWLSNISE